MSDAIHGLWVALATPIAADGSVDHAALVRHANRLTDAGCDGFVPFGTTGEGTSFSAAERLAAIEAMLAGGIAPGRIALGAGSPAITDTIALTRSALALGLHHVLILPPYYYRDVDAAGIEDAFAAIFDGVGDSRLRATLYNIPQVSGLAVPPEVAAHLRQRFGAIAAGVKDSTGIFESFRAYRAAAPDLAMVVGAEADAIGPMQAVLALMQAPFLPTLKSILAAQTGEAGWSRVRAPLRAADPAIGQRIAATMASLAAAKAA